MHQNGSVANKNKRNKSRFLTYKARALVRERWLSWFRGSASWTAVLPLEHEAPPLLLLRSPIEAIWCWD